MNAVVAVAEVHNSLIGQIRNTPDYIAKTVNVCKFLGIEVYVSAYEADPQVSFVSLSNGLIAVTGDSDLLAYGVARKLILVKGFLHEWYRVIDLDANTTAGEYPLLDLYKNHGKVVFQLYAGCRGCDFTNTRSGIQGLGFKKFIALAVKVQVDSPPEVLPLCYEKMIMTLQVRMGLNQQMMKRTTCRGLWMCIPRDKFMTKRAISST